MNQGVFKRMRRGRKDGARVRLPFDDIMEFAIALLSISPQELEALRWTFADRKRLLDHLLASGRAAQGVDPERLGMLPIEISIPRDDLTKMQQFAVRELPKAASKAAVIDRVLTALDLAAHRQDREAR
ncbi:hypothetical protein M527_17480 [Sphingobium indicum IP26]|uniref:Uncharacterized protein n=3 Tax=Sphingomonadaceae TaxID=41297 RepID=A0A1E1F8N0_9SPHN|nr:hypothetical protein M527_17480 [Sphingobium indicum IP26]EZP70258.1 hypothetical protein BV96_03501 [Sphingomonas paucimobilis]KER34534.1 hypothetical protein AL00_20525 [Sphingobium indicum F2]PJG45421.1 hypothetical protein CAF53_21965 [Sphingobium sp. LB126]SKC11006.1 hypothetical protein SAMN06295920_11845 [Rhizorhabdus histidinilytica]BAV66781.1 hypothetical protein SCLO_3001140 [Sphingobium cloacae]